MQAMWPSAIEVACQSFCWIFIPCGGDAAAIVVIFLINWPFLFPQGNMGLGFQGEKGEKVSGTDSLLEKANK